MPLLPEAFAHALALYPDCPAAWLIEGWADDRHIDLDRGIGLLKRLIATHFDSRDVQATRLRLVPIGRLVRAGRIRVSPDFVDTSYIPRYPGDLSEEEQQIAESEIRAMYAALRASDIESDPSPWAAHFWRQNFKISGCELVMHRRMAADDPRSPSDVESNEEETPTLGDLRDSLVAAGDALTDELRSVQLRAEIDLYAPEVDEVKLGLARVMSVEVV